MQILYYVQRALRWHRPNERFIMQSSRQGKSHLDVTPRANPIRKFYIINVCLNQSMNNYHYSR
jgi:hypothetical protein